MGFFNRHFLGMVLSCGKYVSHVVTIYYFDDFTFVNMVTYTGCLFLPFF